MAEKLRSISSQIPWSLALKAFVFALAWWKLPFWAFFLIAVYLYFIPVFQPGKVLLPFALTVFLAWAGEPSVWAALFLGTLFFLTLGIKDLIIVERDTAYNLLTFVLYFLVFFYTYLRFDDGIGYSAVLWLAFSAVLFFFLTKGMLGYGDNLGEAGREHVVVLSLLSFFLFELGIALLFLSINFFYQAALLFFAGVILFEIYVDYLKGTFGARKGLLYFSVFFSVAAFALTLAEFTV